MWFDSGGKTIFGFAADLARIQSAEYIGGACPAFSEDEQTRAEVDAEELALLDRAEARAINSGAW